MEEINQVDEREEHDGIKTGSDPADRTILKIRPGEMEQQKQIILSEQRRKSSLAGYHHANEPANLRFLYATKYRDDN